MTIRAKSPEIERFKMIQSIAANPHQTSPFRHGNVLFASVATYKRNLPGIGRCLSQGAAVGMFLGFLSPVFGMLSHPENGYNYRLGARS